MSTSRLKVHPLGEIFDLYINGVIVENKVVICNEITPYIVQKYLASTWAEIDN